MKAISLHQPWASLIAVDAKRVETRHWRPPPAIVGKRIAIHAARTTNHLSLARLAPFRDYLPADLPLGALIATAMLLGVVPIADVARVGHTLAPHERAFGNYDPGRYAWLLGGVRAIAPVAWRGAQGFFDVPELLLGQELSLC